MEQFLIEYAFSAALGNFMDTEYPRKIVFEKLAINKTTIFERRENLEVGELKSIEPLLVNAFDPNVSQAMAAANLNDEELFLMNGFKAMFSAKLVSMIINWLNNKFLVIYRANFLRVTRTFSEGGQDAAYVVNSK